MPSYDTTLLLRFLILRIFHNSLYGSLIFPILLSSSSIYSLSLEFSWLISSSFSLIVSIVLCSLILSPFQHLQFLSSFAQYSLLYLLISSISFLYSFSNSSITSFALPRFFFPFQVFNSTINPFYCTRYLSLSLIHYLFNILSISYSFSSSIITRTGCFFFCLFTCFTYLHILLTLTTGCILIVAGSSSSTAFVNIIFLIL